MQIFTLPDGSVVGPFNEIEPLSDGNYMADGAIIPADQVTGGLISTVSDDYISPSQQAIIDAKVKAEQEAKDAKASALAKLTALGLTIDEVKALVG
jgi:hypothetical protein